MFYSAAGLESASATGTRPCGRLLTSLHPVAAHGSREGNAKSNSRLYRYLRGLPRPEVRGLRHLLVNRDSPDSHNCCQQRPPSNRHPALLVPQTDPSLQTSPLNSIFMLGGAPTAHEVLPETWVLDPTFPVIRLIREVDRDFALINELY